MGLCSRADDIAGRGTTQLRITQIQNVEGNVYGYCQAGAEEYHPPGLRAASSTGAQSKPPLGL